MVLPRLGQFSPQILEPENFGEPNAPVATELLKTELGVRESGKKITEALGSRRWYCTFLPPEWKQKEWLVKKERCFAYGKCHIV